VPIAGPAECQLRRFYKEGGACFSAVIAKAAGTALERDEEKGTRFSGAIKFMQIALIYLHIPLDTYEIDHVS